jgi:hypothetical protein
MVKVSNLPVPQTYLHRIEELYLTDIRNSVHMHGCH